MPSNKKRFFADISATQKLFEPFIAPARCVSRLSTHQKKSLQPFSRVQPPSGRPTQEELVDIEISDDLKHEVDEA